jgi:hypothetical protein
VNPGLPSERDGLNTGGGIYNAGTMTIVSCAVTNNTAGGFSSGYGGGICNAGNMTIANSLISGNIATTSFEGIGIPGSGGGIYNAGSLTVTNTTLYKNSADSGGGIGNGGSLGMRYDTVSGSLPVTSSGGGGNIFAESGTLTMQNTILANSAGNCLSAATVTSAGYNLSDDNTCFEFLNNTGDLNNTPAGLNPNGLQNNGGPTESIALIPNSAAVDAILPGAPLCQVADGVVTGPSAPFIPLTPVSDQRSVSRPQGAGCDIGAFESTVSHPPVARHRHQGQTGRKKICHKDFVRAGASYRKVWPPPDWTPPSGAVEDRFRQHEKNGVPWGADFQIVAAFADLEGDGAAELIVLQDRLREEPTQTLAVYRLDRKSFHLVAQTSLPPQQIAYLISGIKRSAEGKEILVRTATLARCKAGGDPEGPGTAEIAYILRGDRLQTAQPER